MRRRLTWAIIVLSLAIAGSTMVLNGCSSFGGTISGERLIRVQESPHYQDGAFVNSQPHPPLKVAEIWSYLVEQFFGDQTRAPPSVPPVVTIAPSTL